MSIAIFRCYICQEDGEGPTIEKEDGSEINVPYPLKTTLGCVRCHKPICEFHSEVEEKVTGKNDLLKVREYRIAGITCVSCINLVRKLEKRMMRHGKKP